ncbi:hypothetical protein Vretimale_1179 [Volvox reticuliferus]|uniref:DUF4346 domain-containing protein n=1 Tax=Volvox reticuliferus TaxID=1737510 RepID=A0A8J4D4A0_9CHLO|nr:hypothetical protein Vretifemale_10306 [Volvox reticuliferus]GIL95090.1 hypothetical protein Vretimale_1179 [Volvox reticuliferus]
MLQQFQPCTFKFGRHRTVACPRCKVQPFQARASSCTWTGTVDSAAAESLKAIDDALSWRPLQLDPAGYFIIRIDKEAREIIADHYSNNINEKGLAVDDETGEVIGCRPGRAMRLPRRTFRGRTAKEISIRILEEPSQVHQQHQQPDLVGISAEKQAQHQQRHILPWITRLEHANYLGREFVRAEHALLTGADYVQD